MESFEEIGLSGAILKAINDLGFEKPTPIQAQAIPLLLSSDQDVIASAQTGTGKTGAFGLPLLHMTDVDDSSTQGLVLCPTRELCLQITKDLQQFGKYIKGLNIVAVYGGASIRDQIRALNKGAQIVVATPGRAKDLLKRKRLVLDNINRVVLDEADEMLTMGFKDELDAILGAMPEEKQILLFSATMSKRIRSITKTYMDDPAQIETERVNTAAKNV
ncbi:MAG: DEAD/DEAH box helicase, partial [Saprospiraceae bacterium]|nr:DEAD/DEAH box helicase [Saprospiraceae bacterium]